LQHVAAAPALALVLQLAQLEEHIFKSVTHVSFQQLLRRLLSKELATSHETNLKISKRQQYLHNQYWYSFNKRTHYMQAMRVDLSVHSCIKEGFTYGLDYQGLIPSRGSEYYLHHHARPALGPTDPPTHTVIESSPQRLSNWGVKLTTHLHLVPRL